MFKRVTWNGKRYNAYFENGVIVRLVELDERAHETSNVITEGFKPEEVKELQMFDEEYVRQLREEQRATREQLDKLQQQLGTFKPEEFQSLQAELEKRRKEETERQQKELIEKGQWQQVLEQTRMELTQRAEAAERDRDAAVAKYRSTVVRNTIMTAASATGKFVEASLPQVVQLLEPYFGLDDNEAPVVFEDTGHKITRMGPSGKNMTPTERMDSFLKDNPHFQKGLPGGAGSGGGRGGNDIPSNLPAVERLKMYRRQQAAGAAG